MKTLKERTEEFLESLGTLDRPNNNECIAFYLVKELLEELEK